MFMKHAIAAAVTLAVVSFGASAAPVVNANHGTINFKGTVTEAPCSIAADSLDQTVDFGQISHSVLATGNPTAPQIVKIKLENCDTSSLKTVNASFTGQRDINNPTALNELLTSGPTNTAIVMTGNGEDVKFDGSAGKDINLVGSTTTLLYSASVKQAGGMNVQDGEFTATADFNLSYN